MKNYDNYRDLVIVLTQKEIKVRYKNSILGYLWSISNPLAFALVFFIAFKVVMRVQMEGYALFLVTGLFPWQWLSNSVNIAPRTFLSNASIIKKINFPRHIIPFTTVLHDMIHFILSLPVIVAFMFVYHKSPSFSWFYGIPLLLLVQFITIYGISLLVSSTNLFFRDLERLTGILLTIVFYFTPIIYPKTMIPEKYKVLINLNPLAPLMISWRDLFLEGTMDFMTVVLSLFYSLIIFAVGYAVYRSLVWRFAEVV